MSIKLNLFPSCVKRIGTSISLDQLPGLIRNNPTAEKFKTDWQRFSKQSKQLDLLDTQEFDKRKATTLQTTCIGGYFPNNDSAKGNEYQFTQLIYIDYDKKDNPNFDNDQLEYLKEEIAKIDFVKLVCRSTRGEGLAVIVQAEGIESKEKYEATLEACADIIAKKVDNSLKYDKQTKHPDRLWIIPSDKTVKYNTGTFPKKAVLKRASTHKPKQPAVKIASYSFPPSGNSAAPYCTFLKPPQKDFFRVRIYADDFEGQYDRTPSGSIYIPQGFVVPDRPHFVGLRKWETGNRNQRLLPTLIKLLMINKGITATGYQKMAINLMNRFEEKWSNEEMIRKAFAIKADFEAGKYDISPIIKRKDNGDIHLQKIFYSKEVIKQKSQAVRDKENNLILQRFIYEKQSQMVMDIVKEMMTLPEYQVREINIIELSEALAMDRRRITDLISTTPELKAILEKQKKSAVIKKKTAYEKFVMFVDAMNGKAGKQAIMDTLDIPQRTFYFYKKVYDQTEGLNTQGEVY